MKNEYQEIKKIIKKELIGADAAHDFSHVMRVYDLCIELAKGVKDVNLDILKLAALFHDIAMVREIRDRSGKICHARLSANMTQKILKGFGYSLEDVDKVMHCILAHRYRTRVKPKTKEAKIIFDADKLDTLGAIGIARSYVWIGINNANIYNNTTFNLKKYLKENIVGGKINGKIMDKSRHDPFIEFEIKYKRVPEGLYTQKAKKMARERLTYMGLFFDRLKQEVNAEL